MAEPRLEIITRDTNIWTPDLGIILPIDGSGILNFSEWINWNNSPDNAYDFAAYLSNDGRVVLGLPKETPVRAIADGVIRRVSPLGGDPYCRILEIEHGKEGSGLFSIYRHIDPSSHAPRVMKGDIVGTLYQDSGEEAGRLVHLRFELYHGWNVGDRICSLKSIYRIGRYTAEPPGSPHFRVLGLKDQPEIYVANFKTLIMDNRTNR